MLELRKELYTTTLSDNDFEDICTQILSKKYGCIFQRFGRQGQCQYGIDAYTNCGIYAQYKNYRTINSRNHFIERIKKDFSVAYEKFSDMQKYVVVTHLNRDTFIQQAIKEFNSSIEILFWEDIENECCTLEQKHTRSLFGDILEMCISFFQDNNKNEESEFYSLFVNLENELNDTDGYMISIETIAKIYRICNFISQRTITFTFQYQPQLLLCYQDLMVIAAFFQNTDIYQNRNSNYYIIDNLKVDCNRHEIIKSDFLELKNTFFSHSKSFLEAIAGKTFDNDSAYDQLDLSGLS